MISIPFESRRLVLARAIMIANFRPGRKKQLRYDMKMVKEHHNPSSKTLRDAALSLANDHNLLIQNEEKKAAKPFSLFR